MHTDDLNIQSHLAYSKQIVDLTKGHQQATQPLLDIIEEQRDMICQQRDEIQQKDATIQQKDAVIQQRDNEIEQLKTEIQEWKQRVENMHTRTTTNNFFNSNYFRSVTQYNVPYALPKHRTNKQKIASTKNQLSLWPTT